MALQHSPDQYDPACGECASAAMLEGFNAPAPAACPHCGHALAAEAMAPEVRVTEADDPEEAADVAGGVDHDRSAIGAGSWVSWRASSGTRNGRVSSVHKASTVPGVSRKVVGTGDAPAARIKVYERAAHGGGWVPTGRYTALPVADLVETAALPASALAPAGEAINGQMSVNDLRELLCEALEGRVKNATGVGWVYVRIVDFTNTDVVYSAGGDDLWQCPYTLTGTAVELGDPVKVIPTTVYQPVGNGDATESGDSGAEQAADPPAPEETAAEAEVREGQDQVGGRILEAKGSDEIGGRIFRVRLIAYGDSKNSRRYPEAVMREALALYEGSKAYDHHRTVEELQSSTINGMVGSFRSAAAEADGLYADLHLLPSATHAAEALDATLEAQEAGLPALVGLSHDVLGRFRPVVEGGRRLQEATQITKVHSVDLVESPAAGGRAERVVAGGEPPNPPGTEPDKNEEIPVTLEEMLALMKEATPEQLADAGLTRAPEAGKPDDEGGDGSVKTAEATKEAAVVVPVVEAKTDGQPKDSFLGKLLVKSKVGEAGLPEAYVEAVTSALPDRITEGDVDSQIAAIKSHIGLIERAGLVPKAAPGEGVAQESQDKKVKALDAFFACNYAEGYRSFRQAFSDFTGRQPRSFDEDFNRVVLRESFTPFDSSLARAEESLTSSSWAEVLGDSVTRRMVAEYGRPDLQTWRAIVSSMPPITDFRTQRIGRIGGYGTLPDVGQGAPYQPLTSPTDEEATYAVTKRGGTEDLTLEMIANDDVRAISNIPMALGRAAGQTLMRFVFDMLVNNATCTYDSTALFHTNHANTDNPAALGQSTLSAGRKKMRKQAAYGDSSDILSIVPKYLLVPSDLEEIAFQLVTSAVAIPSTAAGPSDTPNIHQGMTPLIVDYWSDTNDWYLVGDPTQCPTIEVGFYGGRQDPELFTQADPANGSAFNADVVTYKIRHVYSGTVLDHRGFYRGAN